MFVDTALVTLITHKQINVYSVAKKKKQPMAVACPRSTLCLGLALQVVVFPWYADVSA